MQYQAGGLPAVSLHNQVARSHDLLAANHSPMPQAPYPGSHGGFYPQPQHHLHSLAHRPQTGGDCRLNVKEEPLEDEQDSMVIDLTPRMIEPSNHIDLTGREEPGHSSKQRSAYVERNKAAVRHHPYYHSGPQASQGAYPSSASEAGTVSRMLTMDEGYSDTETQMQGEDKDPEDQSSMVTGTFRFSIPKNSMSNISHTQPRAKREFVPDNKKDDQYWNKRHKNNISARRSRIKRKTMEKLMEHRMVELEQENIRLKYELKALKRMFGDKVSTDLSTSPAGSPESSSSSGIGMSNNSNMSSGGSAEHSTSSSPELQADDASKMKKASFQLKVKLGRAEGTEDSRREDLDHHSVCPPSPPSVSPPAAHGHSSSPPAPPHNNPPHSIPSGFPPAAHHTYGSSWLTPAHSGSTNAGGFFTSQNSPWPRPAHSNTFHEAHSARTSVPAPAVQASHREAWGQSCSPCSPDSSPRPVSSPGGVTTSEDDTSSSSGSRVGSRSAQDDKPLHSVPLKCRMKRELHSAFCVTTSKDSVSHP